MTTMLVNHCTEPGMILQVQPCLLSCWAWWFFSEASVPWIVFWCMYILVDILDPQNILGTDPQTCVHKMYFSGYVYLYIHIYIYIYIISYLMKSNQSKLNKSIHPLPKKRTGSLSLSLLNRSQKTEPKQTLRTPREEWFFVQGVRPVISSSTTVSNLYLGSSCNGWSCCKWKNIKTYVYIYINRWNE